MPVDAKHLAARRELAQGISAVERPGPAANQRIQEALAASAADARNALVVGLTGAPGAGKSSLAAALADVARAGGRRVAILAIDPSSHESGGALLGDRVRIDEHPDDDGRFTRSIATRGSGRSLAHVAAAATILVEAAGFDLIFVETVGAGQAEIGIARLADVLLVVEGPEGGDEVQAMKAGILEVADIVAVNKSDRSLRSSLPPLVLESVNSWPPSMPPVPAAACAVVFAAWRRTLSPPPNRTSTRRCARQRQAGHSRHAPSRSLPELNR
jgi:LAO/AO transport system kinase